MEPSSSLQPFLVRGDVPTVFLSDWCSLNLEERGSAISLEKASGWVLSETGDQPRGWKHGFNSWVGKIPWSRTWQPTAVFLPGKFHGQRNLRGHTHTLPQWPEATGIPYNDLEWDLPSRRSWGYFSLRARQRAPPSLHQPNQRTNGPSLDNLRQAMPSAHGKSTSWRDFMNWLEKSETPKNESFKIEGFFCQQRSV